MYKKLFVAATGTLSSTEKILFAKRLSLYLHSGIPIQIALSLILEDTKKKKALLFYKTIQTEVSAGRTLSSALEKFPKTFAPFSITLIHAGEASGRLADNLAHLAKILKRQQALKKQLIGAALYPAIVLVGTLGICSFLVLYAFPKIVPLFKGFHAVLPLPTRIMISISETFKTQGWFILFGLVLTGTALYSLLRIPHVREWFQIILLRVPVVGKVMTSYHIASMCRMLGTLLASGTSLVIALRLTTQGVKNIPYKKSLQMIEQKVQNGMPLTTHMREETRLYPSLALQLLASGEMTGTFPESLTHVASIYEEQLEDLTSQITTLIEPALMIIMGSVVGFVSLAIITPIYGLTQNLTTH
jgi:general secretion pathway protein F